MIAKRTTTKTVHHWLTVTFSPEEADRVRRVLGEIRVKDDGLDRARMQLYNALASALGGTPPGPDDEFESPPEAGWFWVDDKEDALAKLGPQHPPWESERDGTEPNEH